MISKYLQILQAGKILENIGLDGRNLVLAQIPDGHKKGIDDKEPCEVDFVDNVCIFELLTVFKGPSK